MYRECTRRNLPFFGGTFRWLINVDVTKHTNGWGDNDAIKMWYPCGSTYYAVPVSRSEL